MESLKFHKKYTPLDKLKPYALTQQELSHHTLAPSFVRSCRQPTNKQTDQGENMSGWANKMSPHLEAVSLWLRHVHGVLRIQVV